MIIPCDFFPNSLVDGIDVMAVRCNEDINIDIQVELNIAKSGILSLQKFETPVKFLCLSPLRLKGI